MCGIAGLIGPGAGERLLDRMLARQIHRGPDGDGRHVEDGLAMGMRRLSIIDLEHGWQPLKSREGRVLAFQNGEIYNYRELRGELKGRGYRFATGSDTEVLAHGYDVWGMDGLLRRIDGMYAIAIFDRDERVVHLARDRFGEKPLFYMAGQGCFAYASSLKSLAVLPWFDETIDPIGFDRYLALHYVPGEHTIFRAVRRLLPGCTVSIPVDAPCPDGQLPDFRRYYITRLGDPAPVPQELLNQQVEQAVRSRLIADVPVGVFLSGGIDSSIITAVAARHNPQIRTYSIGFPGLEGDESPHAEAVARHLGTRHRTFHFDSGKFYELLPEVAAALDEPIGDQATLPLFWLCREASREVKVVLSGEGGDELFGGYGYYRPFVAPTPWQERLRWLLANPTRVVPELLGAAETASGFPILSGTQERALFRDVGDDADYAWEAEMRAWLRRARDPLQRATAADIAGWLPDDLLVKLDRIGMAHSLEGRAPFLSPNLVATALNLAPEQRVNGNTTKVALRKVAHALLPSEIVERPKQGFVLPMKRWLHEWFERAGGSKTYLESGAFPGLNVQNVSKAIDEDIAGGVHRERLLFSLVMLIEWWRSTREVV
jgi:asparagine synthase (glutamine-hydrolysing)